MTLPVRLEFRWKVVVPGEAHSFERIHFDEKSGRRTSRFVVLQFREIIDEATATSWQTVKVE